MAKRAKDLIVFIERSSLTFAGGLLERPQKLTFDERLLLDLEVVDKKVFIDQVLGVIAKVEKETNLILVFSDDSLFVKDIPLTSSATAIETLENEFLSLVPFDKVARKLIKLSDKYKLVAINWDMCDVLSEALNLLGYKLKIVIPAFIVSNFNQNAGLSDSVASIITSKQEFYKAFSLIENSIQNQKVPMKLIVNPQKSKLPILLGVFIFLIIIFAILLINRN